MLVRAFPFPFLPLFLLASLNAVRGSDSASSFVATDFEFRYPLASTVWPQKCSIALDGGGGGGGGGGACEYTLRMPAQVDATAGNDLRVGLFRVSSVFHPMHHVLQWWRGHPDRLVASNPLPSSEWETNNGGVPASSAMGETFRFQTTNTKFKSGGKTGRFYLAVYQASGGRIRRRIRILARSQLFSILQEGPTVRNSPVRPDTLVIRVSGDKKQLQVSMNVQQKGAYTLALVGITTGKTMLQKTVHANNDLLVTATFTETPLLAQRDPVHLRVRHNLRTVYQSNVLDLSQLWAANPYPIHYIYGYDAGSCPTCFCIVEAALQHTQLPIFVHAKNPAEFQDEEWFAALEEPLRARVHVLPLNFTAIYKETPLEGFAESQLLQESNAQIYQLADAARLALVYKYGGVYFDMDMLMLHPGVERHTFTFGQQISKTQMRQKSQLGHTLNNAYFNFPQHDPYVWYLMQRFLSDYNRKDWGWNGPYLVTKVMTQCKLRMPPFHLGARSPLVQTCRRASTLAHQQIFPLYWADQESVMRRPADHPDSQLRLQQWMHDWRSYVVKLGGRKIVATGVSADSMLVHLMEQQCPVALATTMQPFVHEVAKVDKEEENGSGVVGEEVDMLEQVLESE